MTSKTAKSGMSDRGPRLVVFVVYPDIVLLDLVGPLQVFSHAVDPATGQNGYACDVVSVTGGHHPDQHGCIHSQPPRITDRGPPH